MLEFNIAPNTQIGRIVIDTQIYAHENAYHSDKYSRSGEFIENMVTDNHIEFCKRWLGLAGFKEFLEDYDEYYADRRAGNLGNLLSAGFAECPIAPCYDGAYSPIEFVSSGKYVEQPLVFCSSMPTEKKYKILD